MGMILSDNEKGVHAESCRDTFKLFTDFGHQSIELDWSKLAEVESLVKGLRRHCPIPRARRPRRVRCTWCHILCIKGLTHRMGGTWYCDECFKLGR